MKVRNVKVRCLATTLGETLARRPERTKIGKSAPSQPNFGNQAWRADNETYTSCRSHFYNPVLVEDGRQKKGEKLLGERCSPRPILCAVSFSLLRDVPTNDWTCTHMRICSLTVVMMDLLLEITLSEEVKQCIHRN